MEIDKSFMMYKITFKDGEEVTIFPCRDNQFIFDGRCPEEEKWKKSKYCYILFESGEVYRIFNSEKDYIKLSEIESKEDLRNKIFMERL